MNSEIQLSSILNDWKGQNITIEKEIHRDMDMTTIKLDETKLHKRQPTIDGYVSPSVLQLQGKGSVKTDDATSESLPNMSFEIPLDEIKSTQVRGHQIFIDTVDGKYTISKDQ